MADRLGFCDVPSVSGNLFGPEFAIALAKALLVNGGLTSINLAKNELGEEGTKAICEALEQNKTLKELDFSGGGIGNIGGSAGAKHVAKMLGVNSVLTECNLQSNRLGAKGWTAIFTALRDSKVSKISTWDLHAEDGIKASIKPLAEYIAVSGRLTALDLSSNYLQDEGIRAVCKAIQSKKETKLASLNLKNNGIGPGGANAVPAMVAVTGSLTELSIYSNRVGDEGVRAICEAIQSNKETKLTSLNF